MIAPPRALRTATHTLELGGRPWLMGVVDAAEGSVSDGAMRRTLAQRVELARSLLASGAEMIDVQSRMTKRPAMAPPEEIEGIVPLVERVAGELGALVSVDTDKPAVARAAIEAGAAIVNDLSGLRDPALADVCAQMGAGLVVMHTEIALALAHGVAFEQLMLHPGPACSKAPAQAVDGLRALEGLHELGRPLLLAVSRLDLAGAITRRAPRARSAGTLAALAHGVDAGAHVLRVHDVAQTADFLAVRAALRAEVEVDRDLRIPDALRWEQG